MKKKGQAYEMLIWIPRLIYLVIVIITISGIISAYIVTTVNVRDAESHILMHRLQFAPEGISYYDEEIGRVYTGILDDTKLADTYLESILDVPELQIAARFKKLDLVDETEKSAYINQITYDRWAPLAVVASISREATGSGLKIPYPESRYIYSTESGPAKLETVVITVNG